ncbi:YdcF family protein [bacterium]|nr:YdcF family protein [bacterium]
MHDAFYIASKTIGMAARAETWLIFALGLGLLALRRGKTRQATIWLGLSFAAVLTLTTLPLGDLLIQTLENRYPADPPVTRVDDIIVLGGLEEVGPYRRWGGIEVNEAGERLIAGVLLARRFPAARLVFTGATASLTGDRAPQDSSRMVRDAWVALGVDPARIVLEQASRTTSENATMTRNLLKPQAGQVHLLVTSAFHMPRAMETFTRNGWTGLVPWPVDFRSSWVPGTWLEPGWRLDKNLTDLDTALKEYLGLLAYRIAGK